MTTYFNNIYGIAESLVSKVIPPTKTKPTKTSVSLNQPEILYTGFNQDYTCVVVGTKKGFRIYSCNPFQKAFVDGKIYIFLI